MPPQVIKFLVSDHLYQLLPAGHEGVLADTKDDIVSNANLSRLSLRMGLDSFLNMPVQYVSAPSTPLPHTSPTHSHPARPSPRACSRECTTHDVCLRNITMKMLVTSPCTQLRNRKHRATR